MYSYEARPKKLCSCEGRKKAVQFTKDIKSCTYCTVYKGHKKAVQFTMDIQKGFTICEGRTKSCIVMKVVQKGVQF